MPPPINNYVFRNNIFVNLRSASVNIKASWFNNLFYRCGSSSASAITMGMHKLSDPYYRGSAQGSEVKNNIFLACGGGAANSGWYSLANVSGVPDNERTNCDYNYVSSSVTTWAKVKTDAERDYPPSPFNWYEPHGINGGDPSLPYLSLGGWKPTAGSVLIDAGGPVDVSSDYDGVGRAKGSAIDIGPYEFDPELVAWWPMEDVSQYRLDDWTGNGHTAYNGNPTNWITTAEGPRGRAGVWTQVGTMTNSPPAVYVLSQYAYVTNLAGIEFMTNGTISLWVQWDKYVSDTKGATRHATLLDSGGTTLPYAYPPSGAPHSWRLAYGPASSSVPACGPTFYCYSSSANYPSNMVQFTHPRDATTWHHVTMTWEAGDKVIGYENGIPFSTNSFDRPYLRIAGRSPTSPPPGAHDAIPWMSIGASSHGGSLTWGDDRFPNDGYFVGKMDDIRIYSRALSPNEIAGLYGHGARTESPFLPPPDEVVKAPVISSDLTNITAVVGTSVSFEVTATGTAPLTYSWTRNSIPISGTTATLVIANAQPADAGAYRVSVSNSAGTCVSASANLIVSEVVRPPSRLRAASTSESLTMGVQ
jgi:hypothetical protein